MVGCDSLKSNSTMNVHCRVVITKGVGNVKGWPVPSARNGQTCFSNNKSRRRFGPESRLFQIEWSIWKWQFKTQRKPWLRGFCKHYFQETHALDTRSPGATVDLSVNERPFFCRHADEPSRVHASRHLLCICIGHAGRWRRGPLFCQHEHMHMGLPHGGYTARSKLIVEVRTCTELTKGQNTDFKLRLRIFSGFNFAKASHKLLCHNVPFF